MLCRGKWQVICQSHRVVRVHCVRCRTFSGAPYSSSQSSFLIFAVLQLRCCHKLALTRWHRTLSRVFCIDFCCFSLSNFCLSCWQRIIFHIFCVCLSPCCALASTQVVRAIMLFNRKGQNSHHHSSKTVWDIEMSFGAFDYAVEVTTWLKFGGRPHNRVKYKVFGKLLSFFFVGSLIDLQLTTNLLPMQIMAQKTCSVPMKCLWGV